MNNRDILTLVRDIVNNGIVLSMIILVVKDMPLKNYIIDPGIAIIQRHPRLISYALIIGVYLFMANNIWELIIKLRKVYDRKL